MPRNPFTGPFDDPDDHIPFVEQWEKLFREATRAKTDGARRRRPFDGPEGAWKPPPSSEQYTYHGTHTGRYTNDSADMRELQLDNRVKYLAYWRNKYSGHWLVSPADFLHPMQIGGKLPPVTHNGYTWPHILKAAKCVVIATTKLRSNDAPQQADAHADS